MTRREQSGNDGHEHGIDWYRWVDIIVWAAVLVIAGLCVEWLFGNMARESVAAGAERFLQRQATPAEPGTGT